MQSGVFELEWSRAGWWIGNPRVEAAEGVAVDFGGGHSHMHQQSQDAGSTGGGPLLLGQTVSSMPQLGPPRAVSSFRVSLPGPNPLGGPVLAQGAPLSHQCFWNNHFILYPVLGGRSWPPQICGKPAGAAPVAFQPS